MDSEPPERNDEGSPGPSPEPSREEVERRVREGMDVLRAVARQVARRLGGKVPLDDLVSHGSAALFDIARGFDPSRARFQAYAAMKLRWAMIDGVRRDGRGFLAGRASALLASQRLSEATPGPDDASGEPPTEEAYQARLRGVLAGHAAALAVGLASRTPDVAGVPDASENAEERLARAQFGAFLRARVQSLPARERALVERHYFGGENFDAIARDLGISKSWASRVHAQAISQLAESLRVAEP